MPHLRVRLARAAKSDLGFQISAGTVTVGAIPLITAGIGAVGSAGAVTGPALVALSGGTILAAAGLAGLAITGYRIFAPRGRRKETAKKLSETDAEFFYWDCYFSKVALIGITGSGKTTLLSHFNPIAQPGIGPTAEKYQLFVELDSKEKIFTLIGDGRGAVPSAVSTKERHLYKPDMIDLAIAADIFLFLMDHNDTRSNGQVSDFDKVRLKDQEKLFRETVRLAYQRQPSPSIILLFNKVNLWQHSPNAHEICTWIETTSMDIFREYAPPAAAGFEAWPFNVNSDQDRARLLAYMRDKTVETVKRLREDK